MDSECSSGGRVRSGAPATFITLRGPLSTRDRMDEDGPFFQDFRVGTEMRSKVGRTVTETDNVWFTLLTGNANQIHFNEDYTRRTFPGEPFLGRRVVNGFLTVAIAAGLLVYLTDRNGFHVGPSHGPLSAGLLEGPGGRGELPRGVRPGVRGPGLWRSPHPDGVRRRGRRAFGRGPPPRGDPRPRRQRPAVPRSILPLLPRV